MRIASKFLGDLDIEEQQIIHFPEGLPAFEDHHDFVILPLEENAPFFYLQDIKDTGLCLIMADPFIFFPTYRVELQDEQLQKLAASEEDDSIAVFTILTIPEDFKQATANLMAPIVMHIKNQKGLQFIPVKSDYNTRHPLFQQEQVRASAEKGR